MANIIQRRSDDPLSRDAKNMLWKVWRELGLGAPTRLNYDFMDYLQESTHKGIQQVGDRKILMAFRGAAKTWVTTTYAVWRLLRSREELVLVTSATERFATGISTFAWQMVDNFDWLADMKPRADQRRSVLEFDVNGKVAASKDASFAAVSITGQVTGRRVSVAILDDVETPSTSDTEGARQNLRRRVSEIPGACVLPGGDIFFLGTAQTEDTLYREYAEDKGYELRIYPVYYPTEPEMAKYGPRLAPLLFNDLQTNPALAGTSTEPTRFTELDILQRRAEFGAIEFDRQFKMFMDAGAGRGNPLKLRDLIVLELKAPGHNQKAVLLPSGLDFMPGPATKLDIQVDAMNGDSTVYGPNKADTWVEAEETICAIDTSGSGSDETCWTIMAGLLGRAAVCHQGASVEGHTMGTLKRIAEDCKRWKVNKVIIEKNFGGGMFGELLLPYLQEIGWVADIEDVVAGNLQKEKRVVQTLEPLTSSHRLMVNAQVFRDDFTAGDTYEHVEAAKRRYYRLTYQYSRMTVRKGCVAHDDRVDSLAAAATHFVGVLKRRADQAAQEGRLREIEKEGERIIALRKAQGLPLFGADKKEHQLGRPTLRPATRRLPR